MSSTDRQSEGQAVADVAAMAQMTERVFAANRQMAEIATVIATEMMEFASRRLRAQMEFVSAMPQIGDVNGMMAAQVRYFERASRDYAEELTHVSQVLLKAGNGASPKA